MADYPLHLGERQAARADAANAYYDKARQQAEAHGRSPKCRGEAYADGPRHVDDPGGCRNDGSGCLCPCHDPKWSS